jgi:hypothetical protein
MIFYLIEKIHVLLFLAARFVSKEQIASAVLPDVGKKIGFPGKIPVSILWPYDAFALAALSYIYH